MVKVKVYPVLENGKIIETVKEVCFLGVLVYLKRIVAPRGVNGDNLYFTSI